MRQLARSKLLRELVDLVGIEPTTSSMPWKRAPSCATGPHKKPLEPTTSPASAGTRSQLRHRPTVLGDTTDRPLRTALGILADLAWIVNARRIPPLRTEWSLRGEKAEDLPHQPLSLIGLEEKLSVGGAIQNNEFFGFGSFLVLLANSW